MGYVVINKIKHFYKTREAVKSISFSVQQGEIFGLLGPNGSGKTTLFRILSTLFPPSHGEIQIAGHSLNTDYKVIRSKIGVVFQSPSLDKQLTVYENLKHQGYLYGLSGKDLKQRCDEMLGHVGLSDRAKDRVGTLSGGLMRRVELAKGLLHKPGLLLLDEPSTGLDVGARIDLWRYLNILRDSANVTILVTTHLMDEAENCDKIGIMNEGNLICVGSPGELKNKMGGDVLVIETKNKEELAKKIEEKFGVCPIPVDERLLLEHAQGAKFITKLVESFPGQIDSITFRKPTLEDVFVHYTGHRFWSPEKAAIQGART